MKIRSLTYFCNPGWPFKSAVIARAGDFLKQARKIYQQNGYTVATIRLATPPFPRLLKGKLGDASRLAQDLEEAVMGAGIDYLSLGPSLPGSPDAYELIPDMLAATRSTFFGGIMAAGGKLFFQAVHACAEVIVRAAVITPDGFSNLRFAALANVPSGSPFFPAAYWKTGPAAFGIATEAADLAVSAFSESQTLGEASRKLTNSIEAHASLLTRIARTAPLSKCSFHGIDFSLAPFPGEACSIGTALERLGVPCTGLHGSLTAAAVLTEAIDRARFTHKGFSGIMLPVLEDSVLARRASEGILSIKDLLLYSSVCGTGLDTVPLPGDVTADQISPLLGDLSALALRLDKPLTARLMPIPGKKAGDRTEFDFAYFANSRVMALEARPLSGLLYSPESLDLNPHSRSL